MVTATGTGTGVSQSMDVTLTVTLESGDASTVLPCYHLLVETNIGTYDAQTPPATTTAPLVTKPPATATARPPATSKTFEPTSI